MLTKIAFVLAAGSLTALMLRRIWHPANATVLEQEVAGELDALREFLFKR